MIVEGVTYEDNVFKFDFTKDEKSDIISISNIFDNTSEIRNNIYHFGYKFNNNIDGRIKSEFLKQLKYRDLSTITNEDYNMFIKKSIHELQKKVNLAKVNLIVYPETKSPLVMDMLKYIYGFTAPTIKNIDLVKNSIENRNCKNKNIIEAIESDSNILIIDDINTSTTTISELLRNINLVNDKTNKIIFTLIGK
jgi:hypoxanthine phosphoribosyltransferase